MMMGRVVVLPPPPPPPPPVEVEEGRSSTKRPKMESVTPIGVEIVDVEDDDDDPFLAMKGTNNSNPISVERYSYRRDLRLAITASLFQSTNSEQSSFIDLSLDNDRRIPIDIDDDDDDDDEVRVLRFKPANKNTPFGKPFFAGPSVSETGQSSNSTKINDNDDPCFVCEICAETKTANHSFSIQGCDHAYCTDCMIKYVASKLQDNALCIRCPVPNCGGLLEPEYCRPILPKDVFDRWGNALCEAVILGSQKFYCPYKDCSALLLDDGGDDGGQVIRESECPNCWRMFCAQCKVPWHTGLECAEFQNLNKDEREREDIMLMNLAQNKSWKRCPSCRFYVEKSVGCMFMKCRCGIEFCYRCGTATSRSHYCPQCKC